MSLAKEGLEKGMKEVNEGAALNLVEIKNTFGSVLTNPQADAWWVPLFIFLKKCFFETP